MTRIVFLDRETISADIKLMQANVTHEWICYDRTPADLVVERLQGAQIAITNKVAIRHEMLSELPDLEMISICATGHDIVDIDACCDRKIVVANVRGYAINTVPEHTFALIFALRRNIMGYRQDVIDGKWQQSSQFCFHTHEIKDLAGATLGIIGDGVIGQAVATIGRALGMKPVFASRKGLGRIGALYRPFDEVIEKSDIITLHVPLVPETRNLISTAEFESMQQRPIIVNTARGGLVDEAALVDALDRGLISGAGFDVLTCEPPTPDNPVLSVLERFNVIVTPHIAWASKEAMQALWTQTITNVENFLNGKPSNNLTGSK